MEHVFQVKGQKEYQPGAANKGDTAGDQIDAEKPIVEHAQINDRMGGMLFDPQEGGQGDQKTGEQHQGAPFQKTGGLPGGHGHQQAEKAEEEGGCAAKIKRLSAGRADGGHKTDDHQRADQAKGEVDQENPVPGERPQDQPTNGGAGNTAHRNHQADQPQGLSALRGRKSLGNDGCAEGHHHGGPHALQNAAGDQHFNTAGNAAQRGADGEDNYTGNVDGLFPDHIGQAANGEEQGGGYQHVAQHHPLH